MNIQVFNYSTQGFTTLQGFSSLRFFVQKHTKKVKTPKNMNAFRNNIGVKKDKTLPRCLKREIEEGKPDYRDNISILALWAIQSISEI